MAQNLRIKEVIKEKGFTISSLAEKIKINRVNLSNMISGNPTVETLEKIAAGLDVSITELFEKPVGIYGLVLFKNKVYRIDSGDELEKLYNDFKSGSGEL